MAAFSVVITIAGLSHRAFVAASVFLLAIRFALRQFRSGKLTGLGELIAVAFTSAVSVGDFTGALRVIAEGSADVQNGRN